jgi:hypothetical protein
MQPGLNSRSPTGNQFKKALPVNTDWIKAPVQHFLGLLGLPKAVLGSTINTVDWRLLQMSTAGHDQIRHVRRGYAPAERYAFGRFSMILPRTAELMCTATTIARLSPPGHDRVCKKKTGTFS